jgi:hypothetical protein
MIDKQVKEKLEQIGRQVKAVLGPCPCENGAGCEKCAKAREKIAPIIRPLDQTSPIGEKPPVPTATSKPYPIV